MDIFEIRTVNELREMKSSWNKMVLDCNLSIFSSFDWLNIWWKHFGKNRKLLVLVAKENDKILGIAPLMYSVYKKLGFNVGIIEFISAPQSDYNDFLILDKREECLRSFVDHLKRIPEHWNYIKLTNIPETSQNLDVIKQLFSKTYPICKSPYMPLPASYDEFFASIGHNLRHNIRKNQKGLSTAFKMEFIDCSSTELSVFGMQSLFELHQKRWLHKGYSGFLASEDMKSFHMDVSQVFAKTDQLNLLVLLLSGVPVAVSYGFKDSRKFYFYLQGIDPDEKYFKYAVGNQITAYTAAKCIEKSLNEFDFLTGGESYKQRWGAISRTNMEVIIPKSPLTGFNHSNYERIQKLWAILSNTNQSKYVKYVLSFCKLGDRFS